MSRSCYHLVWVQRFSSYTSSHHHGARNITLWLQICSRWNIYIARWRLLTSRWLWYKSSTILTFIAFLYLIKLILIQTNILRIRYHILQIILNVFAKSVTASGYCNVLRLLKLTIWCVIILLQNSLEFFVSLFCRVDGSFCFDLVVIFIVRLNTFFHLFVHLWIL